MKKIFIYFVFFVFILCSMCEAVVPVVYEVTNGKLKQGETITVDCTNVSLQESLTVNLWNNVDFTESTIRNACVVTSRTGYTGPIQFTADFTSFNLGDKAYVAVVNYGAGFAEYSVTALPVRYGYPYTIRLEGDSSQNNALSITGNGYSTNTDLAAVVVTDNQSYASSTKYITQTGILKWSPTQIGFTLDKGTLSDGNTAYVFVRDSDGAMYGTADVSFTVGQPTISNVTFSNNTVSIAGTNFKARGGIDVIFDDFEIGVAGDNLMSHNLSWSDYHTNGGGIFSAERKYSGSLSIWQDHGTGQHDGIDDSFNTAYVSFLPVDKCFISYMISYVWTGSPYGVTKASRINSSQALTPHYNGPGDTGMGTSVAGVPTYETTYYNNGDYSLATKNVAYFPPVTGTWTRMEMYKEISTAGEPDGFVYYRCGSAYQKGYGVLTRAKDYTFQLVDSLVGLEAANITGSHLDIYIDDYYVATTLARAFICSTPYYSEASTIAILPITTWADTSILAQLKIGQFIPGEQLYIIVVDSNGYASEGYPITIPGTSLNTTGTLEYSGSLTME